MKKILFVDDELQVLRAIRRVFMDSGHQIFLAEDANTALRILSEHTVDMVVTDMRMPEMDGVELLRIIKQKYPRTVRIILSGYADGGEITYMLQSNLAKAYMFKPWNNDELLRVVAENLDFNGARLPKEIISYINNLDRLPTTGARHQNILQAVEENKDIAVISAEIEKDQTLTAKILQIVNSAYYGVKTGSVKKALSFIGINELQKLVMSMDIMKCLSITGAGYKIAETIWNHAFYTNKIQQIIQEIFLHKKRKHADMTAGLLHKIGIVFMLKYDMKNYLDMLEKSATEDNIYLYQLEQEKYGFSHTSLSAYLLKWWNAPAEIAEAAERYISPLEEDISNQDLACIVHIAQHYASAFLDIKPFCDLQAGAFERLGFDRIAFEEKYKTLLDIKEGI